MSRERHILFAGPAHWRVACHGSGAARWTEVPVASPQPLPSELAAALADALCRNGHRGDGVLLALPSAWCLCAGIRVEDLPRRKRLGAMLFRMEEKLPVAAEEVAADFAGDAASALGIAVARDALEPIIEALEQRGIAIERICPEALLAAQWLLTQRGLADPPIDAILWGDGANLQWIVCEDGRPVGWRMLWHADTELELAVRSSALAANQPLRLAACAAEPAVLERLRGMPEIQLVSQTDLSLADAAAAGGAAALSGTLVPWIDLRQFGLPPQDRYGRLGRPLTAALAAACLLLATLSGAML